MTSERVGAMLVVAALSAPGWALAQAPEPMDAPTAIDAIDWRPCELPADTPLRAECATVSMPRYHDEPGEGTIDIAVARHRGGEPTSPPTRLWYVAGGPGDAGTEALPRLRSVFPDAQIDIYTFDHRGTGGSARLGCPQQEAADSAEGREIADAEWPPCIEHLRATRDDLDALTTTQSAHDLAALIAAQPEGRDVVFGASYGTYLVNRYLLLYPDQPDAVILDGLVPADWTFAEFDSGLETTARRLLDRCAQDDECAARLGPDPAARARDLARSFDDGHCSTLGVDGHTVRLLLGNLLMGGPRIWPYIPPLIFRLEQCRIRDMLAVGSLVDRLFESGKLEEPASHSPALQRHVALSEMWPDPPPDPAELSAAIADVTMTTGVSAGFARTAARWPTYPRPELGGRFAHYAGPLLLLHGGLDPTMPVERLAGLRDAYAGPSTTFVLFPDRGHVVLNENPCARSLYRAFMTDPRRPPDTSCVAADQAFAPASLPAGQESAFGTRDLWGDSLAPEQWQLLFFGLAALAAMLATGWILLRRRRRRREADDDV